MRGTVISLALLGMVVLVANLTFAQDDPPTSDNAQMNSVNADTNSVNATTNSGW